MELLIFDLCIFNHSIGVVHWGLLGPQAHHPVAIADLALLLGTIAFGIFGALANS